MPTILHPTLTLLPDLPSEDTLRNQQETPEAVRIAAFDELRGALARYLETPGAPEAWRQLLATRLAASAVMARFPRKERDTPQLHEAHGLVREMAKSGVHDRVVDPEDLGQAAVLVRKGWPGVLAAMLLVPAWQWPAAPLLLEVPDWLRADYVRWLFAAPHRFTANGQAEPLAAFILQRLEELVRWLNRGPGGTEEMKVLAAYASHSSLLPVCLGRSDLRRQAELRGQLLLRIMGQRDDQYRAPLKPRAGRRLRIGIVIQNFDPTPELQAILPLFVQLPADRFEVILFTYVCAFSSLENFCRQKASALYVLPADLKEQLTLLRSSALDVVMFGAELTADCNVVTRLALHRLAPLQVVNNMSGLTTGLPEIDLRICTGLAAVPVDSQHFTERLGLIPRPVRAFAVASEDAVTEEGCTRADFGLPADVCVFVSTADFRKIIPEMQEAWIRLLKAVPGSFLLVHPFATRPPASHLIAQFYEEFETRLKSAGVDAARLVVSTVEFRGREELKGLVGLGDVYLDTFPFSGAAALADPLELGLPVVAWEGGSVRSRTGAAWLRELGLGELVAHTVGEYETIAGKLATDPIFRVSCHERILLSTENCPGMRDTSATSQDFGTLMETAFDELLTQGRSRFRANPLPLQTGNR